MTRSFAKRYRNCKTCRGMKRFASKAVRALKNFSINGSAYKRLFCSWNINDTGRAKYIPPVTEDSSDFDKEWIEEARRK